jgi:hypothetical protein
VSDLVAETDLRSDRVVGGNVALVVVVLAWIVVLWLYLQHSIVLSSDSLNNHVHTWWIADQVWHHGTLPWRFELLGGGDAYAYPYGFVNWTSAALVGWPLFGNWAVTLWTAIGVVGSIVATFVAFPELRQGWWAAATLANSALLEALIFGQQSFAWGAMLLLFGMAAWRRGRRPLAAALVGLAQLTHVVIVAPIALVVVLLYLPFTNDRGAVLRWYALSCAIALPALFVFLTGPSADSGISEQVVNFFGTLGPRILIVVVPWFFVLLRRLDKPWLAPAALLVPVLFNFAFYNWLEMRPQVGAIVRDGADTATLDAYLGSPQFAPGATYRVLRGGDSKPGMYHVVQAGGQLDGELFPESMAIHSFDSVAEYEQFLCDRHIDQVIHYRRYDDARNTNEHEMLERTPMASVLTHGDGYEVYAIDRARCRVP